MRNIILLRHAKVEINIPSIYSSQMKEFIKAYNQAPVEFDDVSDALKSIINCVDIVLSSELSKMKETLKYLGKEAQHSDTVLEKTGNGNLGYTVFQVDENIEC